MPADIETLFLNSMEGANRRGKKQKKSNFRSATSKVIQCDSLYYANIYASQCFRSKTDIK